MLNANAQAFLWRLIRLGLMEDHSKLAMEWVASLYDRGLDLPTRVESLLADYWASGDRTVLLSLARTMLEGFCLDVELRTRLAAYLFADGKIDEVQACAFLSFEGVNLDDLPPSVQRVADVVWLLMQDSQAQVNEPNDDSLLSDALRSLAKEGETAAE